MTRLRPRFRRTWLPLALFGALAVSGCGSTADSASAFAPGTGGTADAAGAGGTAGTSGDGAGGTGGDRFGDPPGVEAGVPGFFTNPFEDLFADPARSPLDDTSTLEAAAEYADAALACFADIGACDGVGCEAFAACCVASGSCCSPVEANPLPDSVDFGSCDGLSPDACLAGQGSTAEVFGVDDPVITDRGIIPNGSISAEGGVLVGGIVDLASQRVRVEALISPPIDCGGICLQSAGIAFTPDTGSGGFGGVAIGLLLSGSREAVQLIFSDQVVASFDATGAAALWALTVSPNGMVEVERDGLVEGTYPLEAEALFEARLAIVGRNLGATENSATVSSIATEVALCDNPRGWSERQPVTVTVEGAVEPSLATGAQPSLAVGPGGTAVAFEVDGVILIGEELSPAVVELGADAPVAFPTDSFEAGGLGEPELVFIDGDLHLFYTAYDESGIGTIAVALVQSGEVQKPLEPVLPVPGDAVSLDSPTVIVRDDLAFMIVRATLLSGATELRAYYSFAPTLAWTRILDGTLEDLTRADGPTDAIDSPSLIVHNSAYQLYYARRTGTRWAIELATSDELLVWRPLGEVLGASGEGFDGLGARGPDAISLTDQVEMFYMGQDGVSFRLGRAVRSAPSDTAPPVF